MASGQVNSNSNNLGSSHQLIYNAFSGLAGRILYQAAPTAGGSGGGSLNRSLDGSNSGAANDNATFSTLITADGQQLILATSTANPIAQVRTYSLFVLPNSY